MLKKQYYLTDKKNNEFGFRVLNFDKYFVYYHQEVEVKSIKTEGREILVVGIILDPFKPYYTTEQILKSCLQVSTIEELLEQTQKYSGRFIILAKFNGEVFLYGDAFGQRQIYYSLNEGVLVSSSLKIMESLLKVNAISNIKKEILDSKKFKEREYSWLGAESIIDGVTKLLPNKYLNLSSRIEKRIVFNYNEMSKRNDFIEYAAQILSGTIEAITIRYDSFLALTAGWDSRILLAASKNYKSKITYYTFNLSFESEEDVNISQEICKKNELIHRIYEPKELTEEFLDLYKKSNYLPRIMPKTKILQQHFYNNNPLAVNINGNGGEIFRCYYGNKKSYNISSKILIYLAGYNLKFPFFVNEIERWIEEAKEVAKNNKIPILDLFYWEQKMGNWAATASNELDIAMEEVSPFNNRELLLTLLTLNRNSRIFPNYFGIRKLIKTLWSELLEFPFNPQIKGKNVIKAYLKKHTLLRYFFIRLKG